MNEEKPAAMKLWGGRFETGPSEVFERFSNSLHFDRRLLDADVQGSQAFARSLARAGVLTDAECARIVDAFESIRADAAGSSAFFDGATDEDVHTFVIRKLGDRVGGKNPHRPKPQRAGFSRYPALAARRLRPVA